MLTEIRIYYEGDRLLRPGFHAFFSEIRARAKEKGCKFSIIATDGTPDRDFGIAIEEHPTAWNVLLRDSEGPDSGRLSVDLCDKNGWDLSHRDSIFWMVEMMESWFHADKDALQRFYGSCFNTNALKANPDVEKISKKDLKDRLKAATRNCSKGAYDDDTKTSHGPRLLALIDPDRVKKAAPNCRRMFTLILAKLV